MDDDDYDKLFMGDNGSQERDFEVRNELMGNTLQRFFSHMFARGDVTVRSKSERRAEGCGYRLHIEVLTENEPLEGHLEFRFIRMDQDGIHGSDWSGDM